MFRNAELPYVAESACPTSTCCLPLPELLHLLPCPSVLPPHSTLCTRATPKSCSGATSRSATPPFAAGSASWTVASAASRCLLSGRRTSASQMAAAVRQQSMYHSQGQLSRGGPSYKQRGRAWSRHVANSALSQLVAQWELAASVSSLFPAPAPPAAAACRLTASIEFSPQMMVAAVIGVGLFYMAPHLTSSIVFRLGCGSLLFTLGSLIILVFIIMR